MSLIDPISNNTNVSSTSNVVPGKVYYNLNNDTGGDTFTCVCKCPESEKKDRGSLAFISDFFSSISRSLSNLFKDETIEQAKSEDPLVRKEAAANTKNETIIGELAKDKEPSVKAALADNGNIPDDIRQQLAKDDNPEVRKAVATHYLSILTGKTPDYVLELANDNDPMVRAEIAKNSDVNSHKDILDKLLKDPDTSVRVALASNDGISNNIIQQMKNDPDPLVKKAATQHINDDASTAAAAAAAAAAASSAAAAG